MISIVLQAGSAINKFYGRLQLQNELSINATKLMSYGEA